MFTFTPAAPEKGMKSTRSPGDHRRARRMVHQPARRPTSARRNSVGKRSRLPAALRRARRNSRRSVDLADAEVGRQADHLEGWPGVLLQPQQERAHQQQEGQVTRHRVAGQADVGPAGRPTSGPAPASRRTIPCTKGLPGFTAICQRSSRPSCSTAGLMWSFKLTDTPPLVRIRSWKL